MLRKILLSLLLLVLLAFGGLFGLLATNSDIIIDKFHSYVENSTGAPLVSETLPEFTLLPNRGLELGASTWQKADGSLSIRFSRASVLISSHSLFAGRFRVKNLTVEDLDLTMVLDQNLRSYLALLPGSLLQKRDLDEVVRAILHSLNIAPDAISIRRGSISLIEPDGGILRLSPFSLEATEIHPGSDTDFKLHTEIRGTSPAFRSSLDLHCSALFTKHDATLTVKSAKVTPHEHFPFSEAVHFSGAVGYHYADSTMTFASLELEGPALRVSASGGIKSLDLFYLDPKKGDLSLKLDAKGSPKRLGELLGHPLAFKDENIFSDCSISGDLNLKDGQLLLGNMKGTADNVDFSGSLQAALAPFAVSGDLHVSDLRLDAYKSKSQSGGMASFGQSDFTRWPRVSLHLSADHLRWDKVHLEKVNARMTGQNGTYELNPLTASLAGSPVTASLRSVMLPTSPLSARLSLNFSVPKASLDDLSHLLIGRPLLSGSSSVNAALSFTSSRGVPSLSGTGSLSSSDVKTSFSILPPKTPFASLLRTSDKFDRMLLSFRAKDGLISVERFSLTAPRLSLDGSGKLDLPADQVDAAGTIRVGSSTVLPVRLHGDIGDPQYSLDMRSGSEATGIDIPLDIDISKKLSKIIGGSR